jgi:dolichol-phosphate mannosyltransferase
MLEETSADTLRKARMKSEAVRLLLLQSASKELCLVSGGTIVDEFEEELQQMSAQGLLRRLEVPEGVSYEITDLGLQFLHEYDQARLEEPRVSSSQEVKIESEVQPVSICKLDLVVVIPALNEAGSIGTVIDELRNALRPLIFEILVVDGHSSDKTVQIASEKGAVVISQRNDGYGDALRDGFSYAKRNLATDAIVMMDSDQTYDAHDIPHLIEPILTGNVDMVVGNRFPRMQRGSMTFTNVAGNKILSWFARTTLRLRIHDTQCGLRAFRPELVDSMTLSADGMPLATEMIADAASAKAKITEIPITYRPRAGETKLRPLRDGFRILGTMIRLVRDTQPLLFFGLAGLILGVTGVAFGLQVTLEWLATGTVRRLPTVMLSVLLIFGSMQFFTLSLVADMIKRSFRRRHVQS